jgi:hypothetical protein
MHAQVSTDTNARTSLATIQLLLQVAEEGRFFRQEAAYLELIPTQATVF